MSEFATSNNNEWICNKLSAMSNNEQANLQQVTR